MIAALSLWQPWATLMALGHKAVETRGWSTNYRGRLVIHAAKKVVGRRGDRWRLGEFEVERDASGYLLRGPGLNWPYRLPLGAAVATFDLIDVVPTEQIHIRPDRIAPVPYPPAAGVLFIGESEAAYGNYGPGRFGWLTSGRRALTRPVPMRGRQGLFRVDEGVLT